MLKQTHPLRLFILCLLIVLGVPANSALIVGYGANTKKQLVYSKELTRAQVEAYTGHKMSFIEKISFRLNKKKFVEKFVNNPGERRRTDGWAIAGLICGVLVPPAGIIFSAIALGRIARNGKRGRGLAIAGLVAGIVFTSIIVASAFTALLLSAL